LTSWMTISFSIIWNTARLIFLLQWEILNILNTVYEKIPFFCLYPLLIHSVMDEWLTLLLICIREVLVQISAPKTGYHDRGFSWYTSVPPGECRDSSFKLGHNRFLTNPLQFIIIHLSSYHSHYKV
jgi:hypothetical protein